MRKFMTKEVTFTTCKVAEMAVVDGKPTVIEHDTERFLGNPSQQKIEKELYKMYKKQLTAYDLETETKVYEMAVEDFMKHATVKEDSDE